MAEQETWKQAAGMAVAMAVPRMLSPTPEAAEAVHLTLGPLLTALTIAFQWQPAEADKEVEAQTDWPESAAVNWAVLETALSAKVARADR